MKLRCVGAFVNWALNRLPSKALTGVVTQNITNSALSGEANIVGTITTATHQ